MFKKQTNKKKFLLAVFIPHSFLNLHDNPCIPWNLLSLSLSVCFSLVIWSLRGSFNPADRWIRTGTGTQRNAQSHSHRHTDKQSVRRTKRRW